MREIEKIKLILNAYLQSGHNKSNTIFDVLDIRLNDFEIKLVISIDDVGNAENVEQIRSDVKRVLQESFPKHKVLIAITNKNKATSDIKKIVLVSSGKGGVGKSTVASYVAQKLASDGYKVGILDADIYGPSIPTIFGIQDKKPEQEGNLFLPIEAHNVRVMSMGFFVDKKDGLPWRGPMIAKAVSQLISGTYWGNLDYLILDMPPGTGDIHLTILQNHKVFSAIVVTLPHLLSTLEAEKIINLYKKFNINIAMVVDNMCMNTFQSKHDGKFLAEKHYIKSYEQIMFSQDIMKACENGILLTNFINFNLNTI